MQLASKMRFVSAQLIALLTDDLYAAFRRPRERDGHPSARGAWRTCPALTDHSARRSRTPSSRPFRPASPTGSASTSGSTTGTRRRGEVRWMCAFDTTEADVDAFAAALREELAPAVTA